MRETGEVARSAQSTLQATGIAAAIASLDLRAASKLSRRAERAQDDAVARIYCVDAALGQLILSGCAALGVAQAGDAALRP